MSKSGKIVDHEVILETNSVVLKFEPTFQFPDGENVAYISLIDFNKVWATKDDWKLERNRTNIYVKNTKVRGRLHQFILGTNKSQTINHINGCGFDCRRENMRLVTSQQNSRNRLSRGYEIGYTRIGSYRPQIIINSAKYYNSFVNKEDEACRIQNKMERENYEGYQYNPLDSRRRHHDILDLEVRGVITHLEANIKVYEVTASRNAWYILRYGLENFAKENHLHIPEYELDEQGNMNDPETHQILRLLAA